MNLHKHDESVPDLASHSFNPTSPEGSTPSAVASEADISPELDGSEDSFLDMTFKYTGEYTRAAVDFGQEVASELGSAAKQFGSTVKSGVTSLISGTLNALGRDPEKHNQDRTIFQEIIAAMPFLGASVEWCSARRLYWSAREANDDEKLMSARKDGLKAMLNAGFDGSTIGLGALARSGRLALAFRKFIPVISIFRSLEASKNTPLNILDRLVEDAMSSERIVSLLDYAFEQVRPEQGS